MLDTPGVLSPRVEGGWEVALRLAVLDLIKYDSACVEAIGAYALYHLATTNPSRLDRWPALMEAAMAGAPAETSGAAIDQLAGTGPDPLVQHDVDGTAKGGHDSAGLAVDPHSSGACVTERFALMLLERAAEAMGLSRKLRMSRGRTPNLDGAAQRLLAMLRQGKLGPICFDVHPPMLEVNRRRAMGLDPFLRTGGGSWPGLGHRAGRRRPGER